MLKRGLDIDVLPVDLFFIPPPLSNYALPKDYTIIVVVVVMAVASISNNKYIDSPKKRK